jgi:hypothetical protein
LIDHVSSPGQHQIATQGYYLTHVALPAAVQQRVIERNWEALDTLFRFETSPGGSVFQELLNYASFTEIEFIISIRSSLVEPDEDGIWHDDGSRKLAFSLSLTLDPEAIEGGRLEIRDRASSSPAPIPSAGIIPTPPFGTMIVFATGQQGFEHKINRVIQGERIIIAGWCT